MQYHIRYTLAAREDLLDAAAWWSEHRSAEQAARWYLSVEEAVNSLKTHPERCGMARRGRPLRHIDYSRFASAAGIDFNR